MEITAAMVKDLREKTDAGMMDCKKALAATGGDFEKAVDFLRKSGITKAEKKAGRTTKEGLVLSKVSGGKGVLVEVLCETDFVAKNAKFNAYVTGILDRMFATGGNGDVSAQVQESEKTGLVAQIAVIGENMQIRRAAAWQSNGKVATYIHGGGRIGVMVDVEGECSDEILNDLCMHVAAFRPAYLNPDCVPADIINHEKEIAASQLTGKPAAMVENILKGKINKWYGEVCLTRQPWIRDDKSCFEKIAPKATIKRFLRWEVGEEL